MVVDRLEPVHQRRELVGAIGPDVRRITGACRGKLERQRDSVMGVSVDEEMTDLIKYQRAFQASAKLITTINDMLDIVMNLKR